MSLRVGIDLWEPKLESTNGAISIKEIIGLL